MKWQEGASRKEHGERSQEEQSRKKLLGQYSHNEGNRRKEPGRRSQEEGVLKKTKAEGARKKEVR